MRKEVLILIAFATICGCSKGGVQVKRIAFVLPKGWAKADSDDKEVSLAVPPGWRYGANNLFGTTNPFAAGAPNDPANAQMSPDEKKKMEELSKGLSDVVQEDERRNLEKLAQKGIILHCVATGKPIIGEELTRFYVKKKTQSNNWTWPATDASEQDCFKNKQEAVEVKLPIGLAHRMQASWQLTDGANYTQISYLIPSGNDLYILRFITVEAPEVITAHEKEVANSLRIN